MDSIPAIRIRTLGSSDVDSRGRYVLYWMTAFRRVDWNFSLQRAVEWARQLQRPLVVFEALRCDYRWASDRLHWFVIQGMADNARRLAGTRVTYFPYLEREVNTGKGLLAALAERACVVVGDDFPCFFLPRMAQGAVRQIPVRFEIVDSNGVLPLRAADKVFARAYDFRRFLQKNLPSHLEDFPKPHPLQGAPLEELHGLPKAVATRWPAEELDSLIAAPTALAEIPINHEVPPSPIAGGTEAAQNTLHDFLDNKLSRYADQRNQPEEDVSSGLSPYLHFGHISPHQLVSELMQHEGWGPAKVSNKTTGSADGWWGMSESAESFLDELITWRELGYNMCWQRDDYDQYDSLPEWAKKSLAEHADDPRKRLYSLPQFESAETHDELWNAAQRQLLREGRIHNYLRMLWGKKILEWSASPQEALAIMIELNNKYALDGRDPNSYSGIFWVLGRYDRAWGPQRPVFGQIRYMSSENTARKLRVREFLRRYGPST